MATTITPKLIAGWQDMDKMPLAIQKLVRDRGDHKIIGVTVGREKLGGFIRTAIHYLPGSLVPKDKVLYHVYLVLEYDDGLQYRVEKNEVAVVREVSGTPKGNEVLSMTVPAPPSTHVFFTRAEIKSDGQLWRYSGTTANCQWFVVWCLEGNGIPLTGDSRDFILQLEVSDMFTPTAKKLMNLMTDAANIWQRGFRKASGHFGRRPTSAVAYRRR